MGDSWEWAESKKRFVIHINAQQRAFTTRKALNDQTEKITYQLTSTSLYHWPPQCWHDGLVSDAAVMAGMKVIEWAQGYGLPLTKPDLATMATTWPIIGLNTESPVCRHPLRRSPGHSLAN